MDFDNPGQLPGIGEDGIVIDTDVASQGNCILVVYW